MLKLVLGAVAAFALLVAAPASACDDCKNCPHKDTTAQVQGKGAVAEADKKDEKAGCHCDHHTASKDCKCGDKCACADCPVHGKKAEKAPEKKS